MHVSVLNLSYHKHRDQHGLWSRVVMKRNSRERNRGERKDSVVLSESTVSAAKTLLLK